LGSSGSVFLGERIAGDCFDICVRRVDLRIYLLCPQ
jgi:hypothetical protein